MSSILKSRMKMQLDQMTSSKMASEIPALRILKLIRKNRECYLNWDHCHGNGSSTHWPMENVVVVRNVCFSNSLYRVVHVSWALAVKLLSWRRMPQTLMCSQHWIRQGIGAVRQQAITWANVDPDLWHHMSSLAVKVKAHLQTTPILSCVFSYI